MFPTVLLLTVLAGANEKAPGVAPRTVTIAGRFGTAEVDVIAPSLVRLHLRGPSGLGEQSVLTSRRQSHGQEAATRTSLGRIIAEIQ